MQQAQAHPLAHHLRGRQAGQHTARAVQDARPLVVPGGCVAVAFLDGAADDHCVCVWGVGGRWKGWAGSGAVQGGFTPEQECGVIWHYKPAAK